MTAAVRVLVLALSAWACASPIPRPVPSDPGVVITPLHASATSPSTATPVAIPSATLVTPTVPATPTSPVKSPRAADYGPMAVAIMGSPLMDGLIRGTLLITDHCVFIESDGDGRRELVVFPQTDELRWDAEGRRIVLSWQGDDVSAASGDHVTLGGGDIAGPAQDPVLSSLEWVAPPREGCMTTILFFSNGEISPL